MTIPNNWRYLKDEEIITEECMCFGELTNGEIGWGKPPSWLVGESYCVGWAGHPDLVAKKCITSALSRRAKVVAKKQISNLLLMLNRYASVTFKVRYG